MPFNVRVNIIYSYCFVGWFVFVNESLWKVYNFVYITLKNNIAPALRCKSSVTIQCLYKLWFFKRIKVDVIFSIYEYTQLHDVRLFYFYYNFSTSIIIINSVQDILLLLYIFFSITFFQLAEYFHGMEKNSGAYRLYNYTRRYDLIRAHSITIRKKIAFIRFDSTIMDTTITMNSLMEKKNFNWLTVDYYTWLDRRTKLKRVSND